MRLGCFLPLVSAVMVFGGAQSLYTSLSNREPTEVTIDSMLSNPTKAKWLKITGGVLDTTNSSYVSGLGGGDAKSIYVPLVPPDTDSKEEPIRVLVLTKDPALLQFTNELREFEEGKSVNGTAEEFLMKNLSKLRVARTVEGLVQYGIESDGKKERKIRKLYDNLSEDLIIIEEGEKPSAGFGAVMLLGGLVLGGVIFAGANKKSAPMPQTGSSPPPLPPGP